MSGLVCKGRSAETAGRKKVEHNNKKATTKAELAARKERKK